MLFEICFHVRDNIAEISSILIIPFDKLNGPIDKKLRLM